MLFSTKNCKFLLRISLSLICCDPWGVLYYFDATDWENFVQGAGNSFSFKLWHSHTRKWALQRKFIITKLLEWRLSIRLFLLMAMSCGDCTVFLQGWGLSPILFLFSMCWSTGWLISLCWDTLSSYFIILPSLTLNFSAFWLSHHPFFNSIISHSTIFLPLSPQLSVITPF